MARSTIFPLAISVSPFPSLDYRSCHISVPLLILMRTQVSCYPATSPRGSFFTVIFSRQRKLGIRRIPISIFSGGTRARFECKRRAASRPRPSTPATEAANQAKALGDRRGRQGGVTAWPVACLPSTKHKRRHSDELASFDHGRISDAVADGETGSAEAPLEQLTISRTLEGPRPLHVPGFVVAKGSKARASSSRSVRQHARTAVDPSRRGSTALRAHPALRRRRCPPVTAGSPPIDLSRSLDTLALVRTRSSLRRHHDPARVPGADAHGRTARHPGRRRTGVCPSSIPEEWKTAFAEYEESLGELWLSGAWAGCRARPPLNEGWFSAAVVRRDDRELSAAHAVGDRSFTARSTLSEGSGPVGDRKRGHPGSE